MTHAFRIRKVLPGTAACVGLVFLTTLSGLALGAGRSSTPGSEAITPGGQGKAVATCPPGTRAISGGFLAPGFEAGIAATVRFSSMRTMKRDWAVSAAGFGGPPDADSPIEAYAYCQKPPQRIRIVTATATVQGQSIGSATAACRANEQAISGGFTSPDFLMLGGAHPLVLSSYRLGERSWTIDAINVNFDGPGTPPPGRINAYAFCRKGGPSVFTESTEASVPPVQGTNGMPQVTTVSSHCPEGSRAISGGFNGHLAVGQDELIASGTIGSVRLPGAAGWTGKVVPVGESPTSTVTIQAICQPKP